VTTEEVRENGKLIRRTVNGDVVAIGDGGGRHNAEAIESSTKKKGKKKHHFS
jgi:hypothetical protein